MEMSEVRKIEYLERLEKEVSSEDFFNILVDLFDLLENASYKDMRSILDKFVSYEIDKKYIKYLRELSKEGAL
jgi:hypothetical protein